MREQKAKRVTLERVVNGFIVRWKRAPSPFDPDPEERVHICPDLQSALQMMCDEITYAGEERDVLLAERTESDEEQQEADHTEREEGKDQ